MLGLFSRVHRTYKEKEKKGIDKKDEKKSKKEVKDEEKIKDVRESPRGKKSEKVIMRLNRTFLLFPIIHGRPLVSVNRQIWSPEGLLHHF